jgi:hypothetical protein
MRVLEVIVGFVAQGKIHPSYAAIARVARCSLDTVRVAITRLRAAGLLSWVNSWHWNARERRVTRTANHYRLADLTRNTENQSAPQQVSKQGASQLTSPAPSVSCSDVSRLEAAIGRLMALKPEG